MSQNVSKVTLRTQAPSKMSPKVTQETMTKMSNGRTTLEYKKECARKETVLCEPHENNRCRVLNNMTEIRIVNSKDYAMSSEKGKSRRAMMNRR